MYITAIKSLKARAESALSLRLFGGGAGLRSPERGDGENGFTFIGKQVCGKQVCAINRE